jgi:hypothetical protein
MEKKSALLKVDNVKVYDNANACASYNANTIGYDIDGGSDGGVIVDRDGVVVAVTLGGIKKIGQFV